VITEFKQPNAIGLSGANYCKLTTYVQWSSNTGGYPSQEAIIGGRLYTRQGTADNTWGAWKTNIDSDNISSQSVASATKATQDGSGNVITSTYATKAVATISENGLMSSTDKDKLASTNIAYATCSTAGSTATKEITIVDNDQWSMTRGGRIVIKFTATNTASNPKFSINGRVG
jgi:hypothetical protein